MERSDALRNTLESLAHVYYEGTSLSIKFGNPSRIVPEGGTTYRGRVSTDTIVISTDVCEWIDGNLSNPQKLRYIANVLSHEIEHLRESNLPKTAEFVKEHDQHRRLAAVVINILEDQYIDFHRLRRFPGLRKAQAFAARLSMNDSNRCPAVDTIADRPIAMAEGLRQVGLFGRVKGKSRAPDWFREYLSRVRPFITHIRHENDYESRLTTAHDVMEVTEEYLRDSSNTTPRIKCAVCKENTSVLILPLVGPVCQRCAPILYEDTSFVEVDIDTATASESGSSGVPTEDEPTDTDTSQEDNRGGEADTGAPSESDPNTETDNGQVGENTDSTDIGSEDSVDESQENKVGQVGPNSENQNGSEAKNNSGDDIDGVNDELNSSDATEIDDSAQKQNSDTAGQVGLTSQTTGMAEGRSSKERYTHDGDMECESSVQSDEEKLNSDQNNATDTIEGNRDPGSWWHVSEETDYIETSEKFKNQWEKICTEQRAADSLLNEMRRIRDTSIVNHTTPSYRDSFYEMDWYQELMDDVYDAFRRLKSRKVPRPSHRGQQVNIEAVTQHAAGDKSNSKLFQRKAQTAKGDRAIGISVDFSGSMPGFSTKGAMAATARAIEIIGDDFVGQCWADRSDDEFGYSQGNANIGLITGPDEEFKHEQLSVYGCGGTTPTADGIHNMTQIMDDMSAREKVIIVITDGKPNRPFGGEVSGEASEEESEEELSDESVADAIEDAKRVVHEARNDGYKVIGFMIGETKEDVAAEIFGDKYVRSDGDDLAQELLRIYRQQLRVVR
jgi:hypothetical protein